MVRARISPKLQAGNAADLDGRLVRPLRLRALDLIEKGLDVRELPLDARSLETAYTALLALAIRADHAVLSEDDAVHRVWVEFDVCSAAVRAIPSQLNQIAVIGNGGGDPDRLAEPALPLLSLLPNFCV